MMLASIKLVTADRGFKLVSNASYKIVLNQSVIDFKGLKSILPFKKPPITVLFQSVNISIFSSKCLFLRILLPNLIEVYSLFSSVVLSKITALLGLKLKSFSFTMQFLLSSTS